MVINTAVEAEKNSRTIKEAVKPEILILHHSIFMGMLGGSPLKKWLDWAVAFNPRKTSLW